MYVYLLCADGRSMIPLQLPHRILQNPSVLLPDGHLSGHGRHAVPGKALRKDIGIPGFHPGDQNSAAVRSLCGLRRIIVQSVIRGLHPVPAKEMIFLFIFSDQKQGVISVMKLRPFRRHILRGDDQHSCIPVRISHREKVGTFPHPSYPVFTAVQDGTEFPVSQIHGGKQHDLSAAIRRSATDNRIIYAVLLPELRIPEILQAASLRKQRGIDDRIFRNLFIIRSIPLSQALYLPDLLFPIRVFQLRYARIEKDMLSVRFDGASGEHADFVVFLVRSQSSRQIFPPDEILCLRMSPVHRVPADAVGIILIEKMAVSPVKRESVRVVHPACRHGQVKGRALFLWNRRRHFLFICSCFLQLFTVHSNLHNLLSL